jgi:DNA-binding NtrC family response regulator
MPEPTVLVVDDDAEFLNTATEIFTQTGYKVVTAKNPTEARKEMEQGDADVAVVDIGLSSTDQKDITGLILAQTLAPSMPKVVVTAHPTFQTLEALRDVDRESGTGPLRLVGKSEGLEAVVVAVKGALSTHGSKQSFLRLDPEVIGMVCLLFALGFGIVATYTINVRWLLATVTLVIVAVFFTSKS